MNGIWHGKLCNACNEKWKTTPNWRIGTTKSRKIRTLAEKETYKYLGILEADTIKQVEMKNKIQNEYIRTRKPPDKTVKPKPYQRNKYLGYTPR